jgi:hypothetical protein
MTRFQIYSHYKLPITRDPLKYGKLLDQTNNKFILQLTTKNIAVINHYEKENFVRIFKNGDLVLEFRDKFINENSIIRTINDTKFLFENDKLISTQINNVSGSITIFNSENNYPLYFEYTPSPNINPIHSFLYLFYWKMRIIILGVSTLAEIIALTYFSVIIFVFPTLLIFGIYKVFLSDIFITSSLITLQTSVISGIYPKIFHTKQNNIKLRKVASRYKWEDLEYKVNKHIFSNVLFKSLLNRFWSKIENQFTDDNHMFILFKIKFTTGETLSIGNLQRLNKEDKTWYTQFMLDFISLKTEYYKENKIDGLIFSYGFKDGKAENKYAIPFNGSYQSYGTFQIPISMNPLDFWKLAHKIESANNTVYIIHSDKGNTISIIVFKDYNEIKIYKVGNTLLTFKDIKSESGFIRIINNKKFYFENGVQFLFTNNINTDFITKIAKTKTLFNNFITIDIETYIVDGLLTPYLICFYDGKNFFSFYLSDYESVEQMMIDCLNSILIRKYNYYKVYAHNMAKFDIIFLFKYLVKLGKIKPIIHNGKFISVSIVYGDNEQYQIEFKDSILLLLYSLKALCNSFKIDDAKSIFPHLFVNENNLNYKGDVPTIENFIEISNNDYQNYKSKFNKNWNLKSEAIKYCNLDCISLYQVLFIFNEMIF